MGMSVDERSAKACPAGSVTACRTNSIKDETLPRHISCLTSNSTSQRSKNRQTRVESERNEILRRMRDRDPAAWDRFIETQEKTRANLQLENKDGSLKASDLPDESAISDWKTPALGGFSFLLQWRKLQHSTVLLQKEEKSNAAIQLSSRASSSGPIRRYGYRKRIYETIYYSISRQKHTTSSGARSNQSSSFVVLAWLQDISLQAMLALKSAWLLRRRIEYIA